MCICDLKDKTEANTYSKLKTKIKPAFRAFKETKEKSPFGHITVKLENIKNKNTKKKTLEIAFNETGRLTSALSAQKKKKEYCL